MDFFVSGSYMVEVCRKEIKRHSQIVTKKLVGLLHSAPRRLIGQSWKLSISVSLLYFLHICWLALYNHSEKKTPLNLSLFCSVICLNKKFWAK